MFNSKLINIIALCLVIVGALNWGLVGLFGINLVTKLLGTMPVLERIIYGLIGLSGISLLISSLTEKTFCNK